MKAWTLLKRLTDYRLKVFQADNNIRLSPPQLVNDKVLRFVRAHKETLLSVLQEESRERHLVLKNACTRAGCICSRYLFTVT